MTRPAQAPVPTSVSPAIAITEPDLLGPYFSGDSWATWVSILKAAYGEPLTPHEAELFRTVAERDPPEHRVRELWVIAGRRAGKDSVASAIATTAALTDYRQFLRPGERASVLCLAVDREQARIIARYIKGYFKTVPLLQRLAVRETDDGLELANSCDVVVANSFRSVRGRTIAACVFDEVAFWRDETCATPDVETYNTVLPGMVTLPGALLVGITTAYRKSGLAYAKWQRHFGQPDPDVLVVYGPSTTFNPTLPRHVIDAALNRDPEAASAEWLSQWRSDLSDFLDRELIAASVDPGVVVRRPEPNIHYRAFADPSGGRGDAFAMGIAHAERDVAVLDLLFERRAPFDPGAVITDIAQVLRSYRIREVVGDSFGAELIVSAFRQRGILYKPSELNRTEVYLNALPLFTSGRVKLLDHERLVHQFASLERRTGRAGRDSVDHPQGKGQHDDLANAVAGALVLVASRTAARMSLTNDQLQKVRAMPQRDRFGRSATMPRFSPRQLGYR